VRSVQVLDSGDLKALVDLYTEDAVCEFGPYGSWHGCDTCLNEDTYRRISGEWRLPSDQPLMPAQLESY